MTAEERYLGAVEALAEATPLATRALRAQYVLQLDKGVAMEHVQRIARAAVDSPDAKTREDVAVIAHVMGLELGEKLGYARAMEEISGVA